MKLKLYFLLLFFLIPSVSVFSETTIINESNITEGVGLDYKVGKQIKHALRFKDANGEPVILSTFFQNERPTILSFVYYSCPILCNMLIEGEVQALKTLKQKIGDDFNAVSVSFNHEDTPTNAKQFKEKHTAKLSDDLNAKDWKFLTADKETIQALADAVGFKFKYIPKQDEFAHTSALIILTPEGKVSRYLNGISFSEFDLKMSLIEAKSGQKISLLEKGLLFCYSFDPEANTYTIQVLNLMKLAGIITLILLSLWIYFLVRQEKT